LPGGIAAAQAFNVVAERAFFRRHQEIRAGRRAQAASRDCTRCRAPSGWENSKAERFGFNARPVAVKGGEQLEPAALLSRSSTRRAVMKVVAAMTHRGPGQVTVKATSLSRVRHFLVAARAGRWVRDSGPQNCGCGFLF
jgi:hypothetical protein